MSAPPEPFATCDFRLQAIADQITMRSMGGVVFEFRSRGQLIGEIHKRGSAARPHWEVMPAVRLETRPFMSWTAAVLYLKSVYIEALVQGDPRHMLRAPIDPPPDLGG